MVLFSNYVLHSMGRFRHDLIDQNKAITAAATYEAILGALHGKCRLLLFLLVCHYFLTYSILIVPTSLNSLFQSNF